MSSPSLGIGLIGTGFLAETRVRCYRQIAGVDAQLLGVASRTPEKTREFAERHDIEHAYDKVDGLLANPRIHVVDLCVPNLHHRPLGERSAQAGKHVICTKPLTAYVGQDLPEDATDEQISSIDRERMLEVAVDDARSMVDAANNAGVHLMYGENWIYAPAIRRCAELLRESGGTILEMRGWECHMGSHSPYSKVWRYTGGGALLRLGAHPLGVMIYLKREEGRNRGGSPIRPVSVTADVADLTRNASLSNDNTFVATGWQDVENWGSAIVTFEDGSRGLVLGSDNVLGGMESKLEVYASNSHFKANLSPNDLLRAYAPRESVFGDAYLMEKVDTKSGWSTPMPNEDWTSGQAPMLEAFLRNIVENTAPESDGELGLEVTRVIYAAYHSAQSGRRVDLK